MAGSATPGTLDAQGLIDNTLQNNYILLNDGTGKLHVYYHDEFLSLSQQIERYYGVNDQLYGAEKRFISFLTPDKHINFLMVVLGQDQLNGKSVLTETFINVPTDLYPTADFKQNIEVLDRNLSKNIRTWAGREGAGQNAKILGVVFGAAEVSNKTYAGIGLNVLDKGFAYEQLMGLALDAKLGAGYSHAQLVNMLYQNLLNINADSGAVAYWSGLLDQGAYSHASLAVMAAELDVNKTKVNLVGLAQSGLDFTQV